MHKVLNRDSITRMNLILVLLVVWSFWAFLTIAAIWAGRCWFPMTVVPPILLSLLGVGVDRWLPPWGTVIVVGIHAALWLFLIWMWLRDRLAARGGVDSGLRGQQPE